MSDDVQREKWLAEFLPTYRDELLRKGMSKETVDGFVRMLLTPSAITINSLADYQRACTLFEDLKKHVPKGDFLSPAAVRFHALGGEMIRFEQEYEQEYGSLPDTRKVR